MAPVGLFFDSLPFGLRHNSGSAGKKNKTRHKKEEREEANGKQQKRKTVGRYSQLLFLRAAPAAVIDPLHGSSGEQCDALAALSSGNAVETETESENASGRTMMIDGQDAGLGSTTVEFEAFVLRERAVKTGRAPPQGPG